MTLPPSPPSGTRPHPWLFRLGRLWSRALGWEVVDEVPAEVRKGVILAAPHTSNWDLLHTLGAAWLLQRRVVWLGKHTLFRGPMGPVMRWLGGVPVDRGAAQGLVEQLVERFRASEELFVVIAPEGSRQRRKSWKSGFYRIAVGAGVPVVCGFLDYGRKRAGLGLTFQPTGDPEVDMERLRGFYRDIRGLRIENASEVRLREEEVDLVER